MLAESRVREACAEIGCHSPLTSSLGEELTMAIREREGQGRGRKPCGHKGCLCHWPHIIRKGWSKALVEAWGCCSRSSPFMDRRCLLIGLNPWNLKINYNFAPLKSERMTITHFSNHLMPIVDIRSVRQDTLRIALQEN